MKKPNDNDGFGETSHTSNHDADDFDRVPPFCNYYADLVIASKSGKEIPTFYEFCTALEKSITMAQKAVASKPGEEMPSFHEICTALVKSISTKQKDNESDD